MGGCESKIEGSFETWLQDKGVTKSSIDVLCQEGILNRKIFFTLDEQAVDRMKLDQKDLLERLLRTNIENNTDAHMVFDRTASKHAPDTTGFEMAEYKDGECHESQNNLATELQDEKGHFWNNLNVRSVLKKDLLTAFKRGGIKFMERVLKNELDNFETCKLKIGVIGQTASGKSSLVNKLRGVEHDDINAAKVDVKEVTEKMKQYSHPSLENYVLVDCPGLNGMFKHEIDITQFDYLLICSAKRFFKIDAELAKQAQDKNIPYAYVRTMIDNDISNNWRSKKINEEETLQIARSDIEKQLKELECENPIVFLVSTWLEESGKWDFPLLMKHIRDTLPQTVETTFTFSLSALSNEVIDLKEEEFKKRMPNFTLFCWLTNIVSGGEHAKRILKSELHLLRSQFGLKYDQIGIPDDDYFKRIRISEFKKFLNDKLGLCVSIAKGNLNQCDIISNASV